MTNILRQLSFSLSHFPFQHCFFLLIYRTKLYWILLFKINFIYLIPSGKHFWAYYFRREKSFVFSNINWNIKHWAQLTSIWFVCVCVKRRVRDSRHTYKSKKTVTRNGPLCGACVFLSAYLPFLFCQHKHRLVDLFLFTLYDVELNASMTIWRLVLENE